MTATSTGHCPVGPGKENGQGITEPNLMAPTRGGAPRRGAPPFARRGFPPPGPERGHQDRWPRTDSRPPTAPAASGLAAARGGRGTVVADLLQPDGDVRHQDQVVVVQDHFDLGGGQV